MITAWDIPEYTAARLASTNVQKNDHLIVLLKGITLVIIDRIKAREKLRLMFNFSMSE